MTRLVVRLLGGFRVELDGETVYGFETDKARGLLAYLIAEAGRPHRREALAGLLWPDRPDAVARTNLRQALARVRRALGDRAAIGDAMADRGSPGDPASPSFLFVTLTDVQFNTASDYTLDTAELEACARREQAPSPSDHRQLLPEAFCADFLTGFSVPDSEAFQAWVLNRQEHYHRLALDVLTAQNARFEAAGEYERAIAAARLQLQLEPWLEEAHQRCMRGLALAGRRDEALRQYDLCRAALRAELAAEPASATDMLYAEIRAGRLARDEGPITVGHRRGKVGTSEADTGEMRPRVLLVAREDELGQLSRHLDIALAGETAVAFISGDAGSGKTALLEAFAASAMAEHPDLLVASARCSPGGDQDALAPLRRLAGMLFGDLADDAAWRLHDPAQAKRLQRATDLALGALKEHGPDLVGTLVPASSLAARTERSSAAAAVGDRRERTPPPSQTALFDQLIRTLAAIGRQQPLLLLLDDLHWVDEASAAFLLQIGRELRNSRVLVLGAYRSATVALGRRDPRNSEVIRHPLAAVVNELRRSKGEILVELDRADGRAFVEAYVDTEPNRLGARFRDGLYAQTGGHALFTVEMLRNLQSRGQLVKDEAGRWIAPAALDWGSLPARVEAAIAERIERLPAAERAILACASVQGDDFSGETVAELIGAPVASVLACLSGDLSRRHHLVRPESLQRVAGGQRSTYRFTHHLYQKYLYDQLDPVERAHWHAAVAASLERQAGSEPAARGQLSGALAWHYEQGGLPLQAAQALHDVGHQALRVSAYREALSQFDHGLDLLTKVSPSTERTETAQLLEVARLAPLRQLAGLGSAGVESAVARAAGSGAEAAGGRAMLLMLWAQIEHLMAAGQFADALVAAERLAAEAAAAGEADLAGIEPLYRGVLERYLGHAETSERHLGTLLAWLTPERRASLIATLGIDFEAVALALSALNRWVLGYPDQALARSRALMASARAAGLPVAQGISLALGANLLFLLRADERTLAEPTEECSRLAREHGLSMWGVFAEVLLGWLMVVRGDVAGIARMGSESWPASTMVMEMDFFAVVLADSCLLAASRQSAELRAGLLAKGLAGIETMIGPGRLACGQVYEAELRRLQGELLLARDGLAAADAASGCFKDALAVARMQGALAWELRAGMSIVRLRERQGAAHAGELAEARGCLAEVYARFTEGFAFPDLQEAAALIRDWDSDGATPRRSREGRAGGRSRRDAGRGAGWKSGV